MRSSILTGWEVEVKIQRQLPILLSYSQFIHFYSLRHSKRCAGGSLKIVTGILFPCGQTGTCNAPTYTWIHGRGFFTSRHNRRSRYRFHWAEDNEHMHFADSGIAGRAPRDRFQRNRVSRAPRACTRFATQVSRSRCGLALARTSADTRQPPSQWRSGRVRARALRRSLPILTDPRRHLPIEGWTNPPHFSF